MQTFDLLYIDVIASIVALCCFLNSRARLYEKQFVEQLDTIYRVLIKKER